MKRSRGGSFARTVRPRVTARVAGRKRKASNGSTSRRVRRRVGVKSVRRVKRTTRTRTGSKRRTQGGYGGDRQLIKRRYGRREGTFRHMQKLISAAKSDVILRMQGVSPYTDTQGFFPLQRLTAGTMPGSAQESMPIHIVELTNRGDCFQQTSPSVGYVNCMWTLSKSFGSSLQGWNNPLYTFTALNTQDQAGGTLTPGRFTFEQGDTNPAFRNEKDVLEWVEVKMDCIGPTNMPCKWNVMIVQFMSDELTPEYDRANLTAGLIEYRNKYERRNQFWDAMTKPYISNPIQSEHGSVCQKSMRVLHKVSFTTQAKDTSDKNINGEERIVKIFKWMNRLQDFGWSKSDRPPLPNNDFTEKPGWSQALTQVDQSLEWKRRIYLIIQAENYTITAPGTGAQSEWVPTYDLVIRKKHVEANNP